MKAIGIIAEYNPFHNGHLHLLREAKERSGSTHSVAVISGNFTQRGEPALLDKWTRGEMAVRNGLDLVLELPFPFACNYSAAFARGGVRVLSSLGCVRHLAFGSESGSLEELRHMAAYLSRETDEFQKEMKAWLDKGYSYPAARGKATEICLGSAYGDILNGSNNILAIEYLKALAQMEQENRGQAGTLPKPLLIKRIGSTYLDPEAKGRFASATGIRQALQDGHWEKVLKAVPEETTEILLREKNHYGRFSSDVIRERLYQFFRYKVLHMDSRELGEIYSVKEGMENRIQRAALTADSYGDFFQEIRSRRYTATRLQRMIIHIFIGLTREKMNRIQEESYIRVLAMSSGGRELLRYIKKNKTSEAPLITNINRQKPQEERVAELLDLEIKASNLYNLLMDKPIYSGSDYVKAPFLLNRI